MYNGMYLVYCYFNEMYNLCTLFTVTVIRCTIVCTLFTVTLMTCTKVCILFTVTVMRCTNICTLFPVTVMRLQLCVPCLQLL